MPFFILFIVLSFLEISAFIVVGEQIGVLAALLLCLLMAVAGGAIVRYQGVQTLLFLRRSMVAGEMPLHEIFDGACLIAAGVLLITPGFVTDALGFLLLFPRVREVLRGFVSSRFAARRPARQAYTNAGVIEGEYRTLREEPVDRKD